VYLIFESLLNTKPLTMKISVKTGHLTQTDKKVVKQMIDNEMTEGSYRKVNYFISKEGELYKVKQTRMGWDCDFMRNKKVSRSYFSTFEVK